MPRLVRHFRRANHRATHWLGSLVLSALMLTASLCVTAALWQNSQLAFERELQTEFEHRAQQTLDRIGQRMNASQQVLRGLQGLFHSSESIDRKAFKTYVEALRLNEYYSDIRILGFALFVSQANKERHLAELHSQGFQDYQIHPEGTRDAYTPVIMLEPFQGNNLRAFGFDILSEPMRQAALETSRDTGQPVITGKIRLVQETSVTPRAGILMTLPVYANGMPLDSVAERRAHLIGWVYQALYLDEVMECVGKGLLAGLHLQIYDGENPDGAATLFDSAASETSQPHTKPALAITRQLPLAGRVWTLVFHALPAFSHEAADSQEDVFAYTGITLSVLLSFLTWLLSTGHLKSKEITRKVKLELANSETRFSQVFHSNVVGMMFTNFHGQIADANDKFLQIIGYDREDLKQHCINWRVITPAEHVKADQHAIETLRQNGVITPWEKEYLRKDGSRVPVLIGVATLPGAGENSVCVVVDISEQHRAIKKLQESQQFLQTVLDTFPLFVLWKDRQSVYLGCNQQYAESCGLENPAQLIGKSDYDLPWSRKESDAYRADDQEVMATGKAKLGIIETQVQLDGSRIWLETNKLPLRDLAGQVVGVVATYQDITAAKQIQESLRTSEDQLRRYFEQGLVGMAITSPEKGWVDCNDKICELLGYSRDELSRMTWAELTHPDDLTVDVSQFQRVMAGEIDGYIVDKRYIRKDGRTVDTFLAVECLRKPDGSVDSFIAIIQDVSERKLAEKALRKSEERYRALMEEASDAIIIADPHGRLLESNKRGLQMLGYDKEEIKHLSVADIHPPEEFESYRASFANTFLHGHCELLDAVVVRKDGTRLPVDIRGSIVFHGDDSIVQGIFHDISERKQAEKRLTLNNLQLVRSNEELARATRLKDEFLANMSHELRTPLNAILGMADALSEQTFGPVNDKQQMALQTIATSGIHLLELINDILDLAKIEADRLDLHLAGASVERIAVTSIEFIRQMAFKKRLHLTTSIPQQLPLLNVDERRVRQVLINLLNNAVKFTPEGGAISLSAALAPPDDHGQNSKSFIRLTVQDNGIGISPEHIGLLFKPFVQVDSALNRQFAGTGLGLALVKRIVDLHGGRVTVQSQLGLGSQFMVDLPCCASPPVAGAGVMPQTQPMPAAKPAMASDRQPAVLLAEDNEANVTTFCAYLRAKGFDVSVAHNGREAVALTFNAPPDLILMDIQMPEMDGLEAIRQIRANPSTASIPIIALTALAMEGDREMTLNAGANQYLSKPIKLSHLVSEINRLLAN